MKEKMVSKKTASLARQKGFNWLCYEAWVGDTLHKGTGKNKPTRFQKNIKFVARPSQTILQKWLREVHNIYVESYHDITADGKGIQYYTCWGSTVQKELGWYDEYNNWTAYEKALEFGLKEGLKLIKS